MRVENEKDVNAEGSSSSTESTLALYHQQSFITKMAVNLWAGPQSDALTRADNLPWLTVFMRQFNVATFSKLKRSMSFDFGSQLVT